jgi:hypothetical protein
MPVDNTTYNFCIESLRYIHKIIGYNAILEELNFIQHLHTPHKSNTIPKHIVDAMLGLDDMTEYETDSEHESESESGQKLESETKENTKNIVIETKSKNNTNKKYSRNELPDEKRCEFTLPTGIRCSFKKLDNSNNCSRHSK